MWNSKTLVPPPFNTFKSKSSTVDINNVISILEEGKKTIVIPKVTFVESALLRRCIYRNKLQLRSDKGFKCMEKTNRSLNIFLKFNLTKDIQYLLNAVPKKYEKNVSLPTRQMLDYVLVRMQGFSQVCIRVAEICLETAKLMNCRLTTGHLWAGALIVLGICSRIWHICKYLAQKCCSLYNELFPLREKLQIVGNNWIPDDYEFPKDLIDWLDVDWLMEKPDVIAQLSIDLPIFNLLDEEDDDITFCGEYKLNDTIIIDDCLNEDDDLEFVKKYIAKTTEKKNIRNKLQNKPKNIISLDESEDEEIITNTPPLNISEVVSLDATNIPSLNVSGIVPLDTTNAPPLNVSGIVSLDDDDIGEAVSRESVKLSKKQRKKMTKKRKLELEKQKKSLTKKLKMNTESKDSTKKNLNVFSLLENTADEEEVNANQVKKQKLENIKSIQDLETFMQKEKSYREINLNKCVTKEIANVKWNELCNYLEKLIKQAINNPKKQHMYLKNAKFFLNKHL